MECTHCGSLKYVKNGGYKGVRRYKCKSCFLYFSDKVRRFSYKDKERAVLMHLNGTGIRKVAEFMNCSASLIVRWIREFANILRKRLSEAAESLQGEQLPDIIEMDEIYTRVKKGLVECRYGLLIHGGEVKLLRLW